MTKQVVSVLIIIVIITASSHHNPLSLQQQHVPFPPFSIRWESGISLSDI